MKKTGSAIVAQATANTKNAPTDGGFHDVKKVLEVITGQAMKSGSCSIKGSHESSTASQLAAFGDKSR